MFIQSSVVHIHHQELHSSWSYCGNNDCTAYLQGTIYGRSFEIMQNIIVKPLGTNLTKESIPGGYINLGHILPLSCPPILALTVFSTFQNRQIWLYMLDVGVAARTFYGIKIIFLTNLGHGLHNTQKIILANLILAPDRGLEHFRHSKPGVRQ